MLYFVSPAEIVRGELIRQVKANTGRDLSIKGRAGLVFYPNLGVTFAKIQLSGPPGMQSGPTLSAERIDLSVALLPLLSRKVQVEHIALVRPVVDLTIDATHDWSARLAGIPEVAAKVLPPSPPSAVRIVADKVSGIVATVTVSRLISTRSLASIASCNPSE